MSSTTVDLSPAPTMTTTTAPALPTVPFTGQAILTGTCTIPLYTMLYFPDGSSLEVPLIGCSDDRPECCPSVPVQGSVPASAASLNQEVSTASWTGVTPSPTPTGVVSLLSQAPLSVCPSDMIDLDPVCCPIGYSRYGQSIIGNLPCVSTLTSTSVAVPTPILASISSAVAESIEATAEASATASVNVIVNQVFALGLPCAETEHSSLSTGAKAGIGAGVCVAFLLLLLLCGYFLIRRHREKRKAAESILSDQSATSAEMSKRLSVTSSLPPGSLPSSPTSPTLMQGPLGSFFPQQYVQPQYPMNMQPQGYPQPHSFGPTFGFVPQQPLSQAMGAYGSPYPTYRSGALPGSPPPAFHASGSEDQKPPFEVEGDPTKPRYVTASVRKIASGQELSSHSSKRGDSPSQVLEQEEK